MSPINFVIALSNILSALLIAAISIPLVKGKVEMNSIYGMRFSKAFESRENWVKINHYGGKRFLLWSVVLAVVGLVAFFVPFEKIIWLAIVFACAPLVYMVGAFETYLYSRRL